ncbi:MAG: ImuA family protein, partial [Kiloniellaceae bacterium]
MTQGSAKPAAVEAAANRVEIAALRARIHALERGARDAGADRLRILPLGLRALDDHLPGGGLPLSCLHEIEGERREWDDGVATGFCLALLARLCAAPPDSTGGGPLLWVARWRDLYPPGLIALGLDPGRLILVRAGGEAEVLWAMEEALRCARLAAVVGEVESLPRSAGRRLQLAAETGGVTAFLLRRRLRPARRAEEPSVAATRWRIAPARFSARPAAPGAAAGRLPGPPRWQAELLRCRGAAPGRWLLEWDDATGGFALAAALRDGPLVPAPGRRGARYCQ